MGFFSRQKHRFAAIAASFAMLLGVMTGVHGQVSNSPNQEGATTSLAKEEASKASINLDVPNLTVSTSGSSAFTKESGNSISGNLSKGYGGSKKSTLTFTSSYSDAILSFSVSSFSAYKGAITIDGDSNLSVGKVYTFRIKNGEKKEVVLTAETQLLGSETYYARIAISNISLTEVKTYSSLFIPNSEKGSLKVDGSLIESETTLSKESYNYYSLEFTTNDSIVFVGWSVDGEMVSSANPFQFYAKKDNEKVTPVVADLNAALFSVGGVNYASLITANNVANNGSEKTIVVSRSGVLSSGAYTISSGVSLIIPNSDDAKLGDYATEEPPYNNNAPVKPTCFRKLSLNTNTTITVNGQIVVCCKCSFTSNATTSAPTGPFGQIDIPDTSSIVLKSGGKLFCWGFITGDGLVHAESGSTVYEIFQITSWRGGTNALNMNNNNQKVFIINQYYIQNVEANLRMDSGATEKTVTGMAMEIVTLQTTNPCFTFIGNGGMFSIDSGYLVKKYDSNTDRLIVRIYGNGEVSNLSFKVKLGISVTFDSENYVLPINNNITIEVKSGVSVTTNQDLSFLPGSILSVDQDASFEIENGKSVTFYDKDSWDQNFAVGNKLNVINYSPTKKKTRTVADLVDARLDLNGTLKMGSKSYLMTTTGPTTGDASGADAGAQIISRKRTGVIQMADASATSYPDVYQYNQSISDKNERYISIPRSCAKLQNGDHSYTQSVPGNTYVYDKVLDAWTVSTSHTKKSGLFQTINKNGTLGLIYLEEDAMQSSYSGLLYYSSKTFDAGDDQYYYIQNGVVVRNKGWYTQSNKHYYIHENYAYKSVSVAFTAKTGLTGFGFPCRYTFGDDASVSYVTSTSSFSTPISPDLSIQNEKCYYKSLPFGVGLFEQKSGGTYSVYLAKEDGTLVKDATYYVSPTQLNSIKDSSGKALTAGLYYFDADGKMNDSSFKTISRTGASL